MLIQPDAFRSDDTFALIFPDEFGRKIPFNNQSPPDLSNHQSFVPTRDSPISFRHLAPLTGDTPTDIHFANHPGHTPADIAQLAVYSESNEANDLPFKSGPATISIQDHQSGHTITGYHHRGPTITGGHIARNHLRKDFHVVRASTTTPWTSGHTTMPTRLPIPTESTLHSGTAFPAGHTNQNLRQPPAGQLKADKKRENPPNFSLGTHHPKIRLGDTPPESTSEHIA